MTRKLLTAIAISAGLFGIAAGPATAGETCVYWTTEEPVACVPVQCKVCYLVDAPHL